MRSCFIGSSLNAAPEERLPSLTVLIAPFSMFTRTYDRPMLRMVDVELLAEDAYEVLLTLHPFNWEQLGEMGTSYSASWASPLPRSPECVI